jgi:hypothetical protein
MPGTTITISGAQRDGLYELVRNHLGSVGDLWDALERDKDFATAARLGLEFGEDFEAAGGHRLGGGRGPRELRADHAGPRPDRTAQTPP